MSRQHTLTLQPAFASPADAVVRRKALTILKLFVAGGCIAMLQAFIVPVVRHTTVARAQTMLFRWDSQWYADIARNGYRSTIPAYPENLKLSRQEYNTGTNVAFFPAYPLLTAAVQKTGLSMLTSMLLVSQFFAAVFWMYVLALLVRLRIPLLGKVVAVLLVLSHPGAFFQITAYSESLFLGNMLGFIYWNLEYKRKHALPLLFVHGFLMSATKLVALPVAFLPLVLALWRYCNRERTSVPGGLFDSVISASGGLLFIVYCWLAFGHWDLYLQRQRMGWGIRPDMLFWLHWPPRFLIPAVSQPLLGAAQICRFTVAATGWLFAGMVVTDIVRAVRRTGTEWTERIALYWCAFCMFYIFVAGFTGLQMEAMVRHLFGTYVLLVLLAAHALRQSWKPSWNRRMLPAVLLAAFLVIGCAALQHLLITRFTLGQWVA